ncbi:hypothetical protein B4096_0957 [Heyndrickxia coagulans]|nr:hypothetical protein B4096_0957 [Heyndrickxia coagulans]
MNANTTATPSFVSFSLPNKANIVSDFKINDIKSILMILFILFTKKRGAWPALTYQTDETR